MTESTHAIAVRNNARVQHLKTKRGVRGLTTEEAHELAHSGLYLPPPKPGEPPPPPLPDGTEPGYLVVMADPPQTEAEFDEWASGYVARLEADRKELRAAYAAKHEGEENLQETLDSLWPRARTPGD